MTVCDISGYGYILCVAYCRRQVRLSQLYLITELRTNKSVTTLVDGIHNVGLYSVVNNTVRCLL